MITFTLNGETCRFQGPDTIRLITWLRTERRLTSVKDGCSGQGACGACLVEIDGKPALSCTTRVVNLAGKAVNTLEGIPELVRDVIARAYVVHGAVQCGFCTPGFVMRTHLLLRTNPAPGLEEIRQALRGHLCRCTGYKKIEQAIQHSARALQEGEAISLEQEHTSAGARFFKAGALETALGTRPFVRDLWTPGTLFGALKFSDFPRARILSLDGSAAEKLAGVIRVFYASDVPDRRYTGLIVADWPLMIAPGETTRYIGDVLCGVVAVDEDTARQACELIRVEYEVLEPLTDPERALEPDSPLVHPDRPNLLESCRIRRGDVTTALAGSAFVSSGVYETQRVEHAFLETEAALAVPESNGILHLYSQGQGVYEDRRQVASILGCVEEKVVVHQVPNGGGFGGKEDLSVQGHAALFAHLLHQPVMVALTRPESIRMHPKRHPVKMEISLACNEFGMLTALRLRAIGDSGAYASVGGKVMERLAGHATSAYYVPATDIESLAVYTNNLPCGAMRGFGVNQVAFALEGCIDDLCIRGGFDRWQFRYDNALTEGLPTATGQKVRRPGVRACLDALKEPFRKARFAGIACGIKNSGVGNGMPDYCDVIIEVGEKEVVIRHGWTEMGQGVHSIAIQVFCGETGYSPGQVRVVNDTSAEIRTGMTTSSRATALLGNAILDACRTIRTDLEHASWAELTGRTFHGHFRCDWTTKPGADVPEPITHYSYGYAAQLAVVNEKGQVERIVAAHDAGKIMNPGFFEGQIEGAVHMGTGYALSEELPMEGGMLRSSLLKDCGVLRAHQTPDIEVIGIEVPDPVGPYGAKGVGEIGLVPTASAIANALRQADGRHRFVLPMKCP